MCIIKEINAKCIEYCKVFLKKCPNNSWDVNLKMQDNNGNIYDVSGMSLFCDILYFKVFGNNIASNFSEGVFRVGEIMKVATILPTDDVFTDLRTFKIIADKYDVRKLLSQNHFICDDKLVTHYKVYNNIIEVMFEDGGSHILFSNNDDVKELKRCLETSIRTNQRQKHKDCILEVLPDILRGFDKEEYEQIAESFVDEILDGGYLDEDVNPSYVKFMTLQSVRNKLLDK